MTDLSMRLQATLGEKYRIERELGGGGMSRVFLVIETALGRRVVIKVLPPELAAGVNTDRGYTDHEHLDGLDLIHMNGRVYDPTIGRFIGADPTVPYPTNIQSYNRYSYTRNNPLVVVDPSENQSPDSRYRCNGYCKNGRQEIGHTHQISETIQLSRFQLWCVLTVRRTCDFSGRNWR